MFYSVIVAFWDILCAMSPYLLFGFLFAGLLSVLIPPETVERHLGGRGILPVIKGALFGVPIPLCSCGVIPVMASLRRHGASKGASTAFLLSTPQTSVDSVMVTFSLLGPLFAILRPVFALISGVIGGSLVSIFDRNGGLENGTVAKCNEVCCSGRTDHGKIYRALHYGFVTLPRDIAKPLLVGLLVAGGISALIPDDYFAGVLGSGILGMLVMMLVGIPIYVCATASVPVAAALMLKGISPGAALVFLMTGPATNAASITTVWKVMGKRTTFIYILTVIFTSLLCGILVDYVFVSGGIPVTQRMHWMLPHSVKVISAVFLLGVLGYAVARQRGHIHHHTDVEDTTVFYVEGIHCEHCIKAIKATILECPGVSDVEVDKGGMVRVFGGGVDIALVRRKVEDLGYTVKMEV